MFDRRLITHFDWYLLLSIFFLTGAGLINLYSASTGFESGGQGNFFYAQLVWHIVGLCLALFISLFHYRHFETLSYVIYGLTVLLQTSDSCLC